MPLVLIYIRVSSKHQSQYDNVSLEMQDKACREYAHKHFSPLVRYMFSDVCSARYMSNQKEFHNMYKLAIENPDSIILVYNVSRFTRDAAAGISTLYSLSQFNIKVISVMDNIVYPTNRNSFRLKLVEANEESDAISERVTNAIHFIKEKGGHIGRAPYGYKAVREENPNGYCMRILVEDENEMNVVRRIVSLVDAPYIQQISENQGVGLCNVIADILNQDNMLNRQGDFWNAYSVKRIYLKYKDFFRENTDEDFCKCDVDENEDEDEDIACVICSELHSNPPNEMILCDGCNKGYHIQCIDYKSVPEGAFFCSIVCKLSHANI